MIKIKLDYLNNSISRGDRTYKYKKTYGCALHFDPKIIIKYDEFNIKME